MGDAFFTVKKRSSKSKARLAEINTAHGKVKTPSFVGVATKASLKSLTPQELQTVGTQIAFVNTYHLVTHPGADIIAQAGGVHQFSKLKLPLMSDSGGFQVFSLAQNKRQAKIRGDEEPLVLKISEDGVIFRSVYDGQKIEFTPEKSMEYQQKIGADIIMAFDECTYYPATREYVEKAMERTHEWLKRCVAKSKILNLKSQTNPKSKLQKLGFRALDLGFEQYLYGIIQGGIYKELRERSAEFVSQQAVAGVAIGGVSVGESKKEMREQVSWVASYLPADKPVHLLGIGGFDDILDLVKYGIDTFDCVEPTRMARMGVIYNLQGVLQYLRKRDFLSQVNSPQENLSSSDIHLRKKSVSLDILQIETDITKSIYQSDLSRIDEGCDCYACVNFSKAYLHHLFKQKELLGYTLATMHNLRVMEKYFENIRELIAQDKI